MTLSLRPNIKLASSLQVEGDLVLRGAVNTEHDAIYWFPADFAHTGTRVNDSGVNTGIDRIQFPDAAINRLKWTWVPPIQWVGRAITIRVGWVKDTAVAGNVHWEYADTRTHFGGNFTATAVPLPAVTRTAPGGAILAGWDYFDLATFIPALGFFGEMPFIVSQVRRLGADAADTFAGIASIMTVTMTAAPAGDIT